MKKTVSICVLVVLFAMQVAAQGILYVKPNASSTAWAGQTAYTNLQDAIDAAEAGDQIWVAEGTYVPTSVIPNTTSNARCRSFLLKDGVSLFGGFAGTESSIDERMGDEWDFDHITILSGDVNNTPADNTDNAYHVVYGKNTTNVQLDGFTITGGYANYMGYTDHQNGGGIYLGSNSLITNCFIVGNVALANGGGAYIPYSSTISYSLLQNNTVTAANSGGGAVYLEGGTMNTDIEGCWFEGNTCTATTSVSAAKRYGGGAISSGSNCHFIYCYFFSNSCTNPGGVAYVSASNSFEYSLFYFNQATQGGGVYGYNAASLLLSNCLFAHNAATSAGACVFNTGSANRAVNCTFVNNDAPNASAISGGTGGFTLFNSIVAHNGSDPAQQVTADIVCKYTAGEGFLPAGDGNLNVSLSEIAFFDPCTTILGIPSSEDDMETAQEADYTLSGLSICKDAGNTGTMFLSGYQFPAEDLAGAPRINGGLIDLGCFEIQCEEEAPVLTIEILDTLYSEDTPGTGTIQMLIAVDNYNEDYSYDINIAPSDAIYEMEDGEYELAMEFPGTLSVTVRLTDENECTLSADTILVIDSIFDHTSVTEHQIRTLSLYPNPAQDVLYVDGAPFFGNGNAEIRIYDLNGRWIATKTVTEADVKINISNLESGVFFLNWMNEGRVVGTGKIVKASHE
ncbi:MAG: T9SS type A sorting domain-containing protein [Bacteroidales bacterium]|nr:T9SS type A sorting domain-containing protein [Bacteroidales bacterium]